MIPRTLVPTDVRPLRPGEDGKPGRRVTTYMDDRTVVPHELSDAPPLNGKSSIPTHLPLGVLVDRTLVPRGMEAKPLENLKPLSEYVPIAVLDSRVVVPAYVEPAAPEEIKEFEHAPQLTPQLREVVEPDIFITGDANLLIEPEEKRDAKKNALTQTVSVIVHIGLIVFIIFLPNIFPPHVPTQKEIDLARDQLVWTNLAPYHPPEGKPAGPVTPKPKVEINKKTLNKVAPPRPESHVVEAPPTPKPEEPAPDLPAAPTPRANLSPTPAPTTNSTPPSALQPVQPPPQPVPGKLNLQLPNASPGRAIQDQLQDAIKHGGSGTYSLPGGGGPRGAGQGGRGGFGGGEQAQILTPTEGVDFNSYINRLLARLKQNWYAVMPESAWMGDKGIVYCTFQINTDGSVPMPDPTLERTSGKEPLDTAAMSAIRTSNPFEPLPREFHGPFIRLRIIFLYNLPLDYVNSH
jgi:hypothetical protein